MAGARVELFWLPLGAGGRSVRFNGRVYEAAVAAIDRRSRAELYHSALEVHVHGARYVIEMAPAFGRCSGRGVVGGGAVGSPLLRRSRLFRYEVRCWRDGVIPDLAEAVESPCRLTHDPAVAQRVVDLVPLTPTPTWGRDELHAGEMWNSNSVISWVLSSAGLDASAIAPPSGGRAPGWTAGIAVARRQARAVLPSPATTQVLAHEGGGR
jgi:hypothetical protein